MAKLILSDLEVDVDLAEITDKHAAELARGIQVQRYKEKHGVDGFALRDQVERALMQRDRFMTLRRWRDEKRINLLFFDQLGLYEVSIGDVVFTEPVAEFPSLKLFADVSLAMMAVPHDTR